MDYAKVLHWVIYIGIFVVLVPLAAGAVYYILLLHQAYKNEERYHELVKRKGKRINRLRRMEVAKRLSDPFFHFNVKSAKSIDQVVQDQIARERGTMSIDQRDMKIMKAIEEGKLVVLDTPIEDCTAGMVLGRPLAEHKLGRGEELSYDVIQALYESGVDSLPVLYNPNRLAGAISSAGRAA